MGMYLTPEPFHTCGFYFLEPFLVFGTITAVFVVVPHFLIRYFGRRYSNEILNDHKLLSSLHPYLLCQDSSISAESPISSRWVFPSPYPYGIIPIQWNFLRSSVHGLKTLDLAPLMKLPFLHWLIINHNSIRELKTKSQFQTCIPLFISIYEWSEASTKPTSPNYGFGRVADTPFH